MAKAVAEIAVGAASIAAAFATAGVSVGVTAALMSMGGSMVMGGAMAGLASLMGNQGGVRTAAKNPIGAWAYCYGTQLVAPTEIFQESNNSQGTSNNKELHRVFMLACHPCAIGSNGTWQLRIDGKAVLFQSYGNGWASYSPSQTTLSITSAVRTNGVVTIHLSGSLSNYNGLPALVRGIEDNTMNGTWLLTQPDPQDPTTFTYVCGGSDGSSTGGSCKTTYPDYSNKIYVEFLNGNHTSTFQGLLQSNTSWSASDLCLGRTLAYVRMGYDSSYFPSGVPNISFVIQGKNNIYDPRTSTYKFTDNAALCIADYLSLPPSHGGFGLAIGTDIPTASLIAAANICDETQSLAGGGTVPQYTCDAFFQLNKGRGAILQDMLTSCAGRLSYQGGTYQIIPGAWVAPTLALTDADLFGEVKIHPRHSVRETCNAVKGVFTGAENNWAQADVPPYMQDVMHGYASDQWLAEDNGERIFKDANFPCTGTSAVAQRLAKIELLRTRYQVRGTIRCSMRAYQLIALDTFTLTHSRYGWTNKLFEVLSSRLVIEKNNDSAPTLAVEIDFAETDPAIYNWSSIEQLTPQGWRSPANATLSIVSPVEAVDVWSGQAQPSHQPRPRPLTVFTGADGIQRSNLWTSWVSPNDPHVMSGGHIEVQWQCTSDSTWKSAGKFDPSVTECFLGTVQDGLSYNVQIRAINCAGAVSDWVGVLGTTISNSGSTMNATSVQYSGGTSVQSLMPAQAGADVTAQNAHTLLANPNFQAGNTGWGEQAGWAIVNDPANSVNGSGYVAEFTGSTAAITNNQTTPCSAGSVISATCMIKSTSGATGTACVRINSYNASGACLATNNGNFVSAGTAYTQSRCVATAPSGTAWVRIDCAVFSRTAGTWYAGGFTASILPSSVDEVPDGATYARLLGTGITNGGINYASGAHSGQLPRGNHCSDFLTAIGSGGNVQNLGGTAASTVVAQSQLGGTSPQEMVVNGNFANGGAGWTLNGNTISTAYAYTGVQSLQSLNNTSTQTISGLIAGHTYLLQMWVMTNGSVVGSGGSGAGAWAMVSTGTVSVLHSNGNTQGFGSDHVDIELAASSATPWTLIQVSFVPSSNCSLSLNLQNSVGGGSVTGTAWIDNVSLTDITTHTSQLGGVAASSITPIAGLMPAQAGADVTGSNTAKDTAKVNGVASSSISPIASLMPAESGANVTAAHVLTVTSSQSSNVVLNSSSYSVLPGLGFTLTAASTGDSFNIQGIIATIPGGHYDVTIQMLVGGAVNNTEYVGIPGASGNSLTQGYYHVLTGLSAGSHTITFQAMINGGTLTVLGNTFSGYAFTKLVCQRIY